MINRDETHLIWLLICGLLLSISPAIFYYMKIAATPEPKVFTVWVQIFDKVNPENDFTRFVSIEANEEVRFEAPLSNKRIIIRLEESNMRGSL